MTDAERYKRQIAGARSRVAGATFENMIAASIRWHEDRGLLKADKTPEPMRPISQPNKRGQFLACYEKKAQVDFCGTMRGGRSVRFEAKQHYPFPQSVPHLTARIPQQKARVSDLQT